MDSVTSSISARELRADLSAIVGRVSFGHERIGVTRNGKLAAVVIGVDDLELLERLEDANDLAAYRAARAADDGVRLTLDEVRALAAHEGAAHEGAAHEGAVRESNDG
ncbi:type II toxin-antitoxin system Phd/YefM family antitoxin [Subtercola lobariae]|nr:type II toxin-antitoxin system Phd/YefM family antitoxin [Subtercola lobariae]